ncbi:MAG: PHB depolymerase family esterase [Dokdonella sp.]|nr:PHB depolymerase family esterase [Dokdonella sp.]MCB1570355.1 PHB depolymerase family esterase [Xanthomonadales bacterium]MCB1575095.1 PHB depolymerase family esterase [Xanthomonadales bacterium]
MRAATRACNFVSGSSAVRRIALRLTALIFLASAVQAFALSEVTGFGSNPGNLRMFKYVPAGLPANAPLVVAMHGCTQSAASYDDETGWQGLADLWKFALVLPQQQSGNNSSSCFNWFEAGDIARGSGEALSIKQMVDRMKSDHASDASRVFVTGLSAGGAMTAVMLATYPDVFAGGAILSGIPFNCGTGTSAAFSCMNPGSDLTPAQWGNKVRAASSWSGPWPRVSIWHGDADYTVRPANLTESMEQWTNVHGIDQTPELSDTVAGYPHKEYRNASGTTLVETYTITGMGHGTPVDPGTGPTQCGTAGAYILDVNICSSYYIGRFWGLDNLDSTPPSASIGAPANGATVSGTVTIVANAADNVTVDRVEFLIDGNLVASDTSSPYTYAWNTAAAANGSHVLQVRAVDTAGNTTTSSSISVTVSGGVSDTTPPSVSLTFPAAGASLSGTVTLSATASDNVGVSSVAFLLDGNEIGSGGQGSPSGPWTLDWNTTGQTGGNHVLSVRANDGSGNSTTTAGITVVIEQNTDALDERFSDRDSDGDYFDTNGWTGDFSANALDHSSGVGASQSSYGAASSGVACAGGLKTRYLETAVTLGANPRLSYARKLDLKANINTSTTAYFRVKVGTAVVDEKTVTYATYVDDDWVERQEIDLAAFANQSVILRFEVGASANVCLEAWARATIDDIHIAGAGQSADVTAPSVNLTAPANGATLSGTVDVAATATDAGGISKVEFYANGSLLATDTSSPYGFAWNTASFANGSYLLEAKAYDAAGNMASDADTTVVLANGAGAGDSTTVSFNNEDANDGYVKAAANGSGAVVGTLEYLGLAIGRGTDGKFNRAVLSFDTASIPDGATITGATLAIGHAGASGNPWTNPSGNELVVDAHSGCFAACTIEAADHGTAATAEAIANIVQFGSGTQTSSPFSAAGLMAINKSGRTQLRLRFAQNQTSTNYVWIQNGSNASLTVEYVLP